MAEAEAEPLRIAIVGGGIGGLCLAIGLVRYAHLKVIIYEAATGLSEIGAGLALGPNAQRALGLISQEAERAFVSQSTSNLSPGRESVWFERRNGTKGDGYWELLDVVTNETGQRTIHRARFLNELVKLVPDDIVRFGKRLDWVEEPVPGDGVTMFFADGTTETADAVIGADGIHSAVRRTLLGYGHPATAPSFAGAIAYRDLIPMDKARRELGDLIMVAQLWCSKGATVMTFPIDEGRTLNVVASRKKTHWDNDRAVVYASQSQLLDDFAHMGDIPHRVLKLMNQPTRWPMLDHIQTPHYHLGAIAMIGDAAHAATPYQGAGAGQAIEDALTLSALFGHVHDKEQIIPALAAYDRIRRPRAQKVVSTSRDAMQLQFFEDGVVNGDAGKWREVWTGRMDWLWGVDLVKQNQDAVGLFVGSKGRTVDRLVGMGWGMMRLLLVSGMVVLPAYLLRRRR